MNRRGNGVGEGRVVTGDGIATDLVVLGSGVGGLTAALTAALAGLRVVVLEHADRIGGTSARSSGTVWVPDNPHLRAEGVRDDGERAALYLASLVGDRGEEAMWRAFLAAAPAMVAALDRDAGIRFRPYRTAPDYRQDQPGAAAGGRALEPLPFDGRLLGPEFRRLAAPLPELMLFGGMMITRGEAASLLRADRSLSGFLLGARLVLRYGLDRLRHPRGTRLVLGNALVARLLKAGLDRGVTVRTGVTATRLLREGGRVTGVEAVGEGGRPLTVTAARGVVLAGGGFPSGAAWRLRHLPEPVPAHSPAVPGCDGSTLDLALEAGAVLGPSGLDNALWFPSSIATRADGSTAVYPHIVLDRAKPGAIAVDRTGRRFVNEAVSYHEFVRAMYRTRGNDGAVAVWLLCGRDFIRRYGLGLIRPRTPLLRPYVRSGYLVEARDAADLARRIGVPAEALADTLARYDRAAAAGVDERFGKGGNAYDRSNGDPAVRPNPCVAPVGAPPYYAVRLEPTPLGTSRGLATDTSARALDAGGTVIPGLYACGNDMQSAFGGEYPGAGAQLGQAMTFAWLAARDAAG